jgi:hypothetical protein
MARRYGIDRRILCRWKQELAAPVFVAVQITDAAEGPVSDAASFGVKVHLALGYVDMRKGIDGLAMLVQGVLQQDPFSGYQFVFGAAPELPAEGCRDPATDGAGPRRRPHRPRRGSGQDRATAADHAKAAAQPVWRAGRTA